MKRKNSFIVSDLRRIIIVSGIVVTSLVCFLFFSPLSLQFTENGVERGDSWEMEVVDSVATKNSVEALNFYDSIITSKQEILPRVTYFDRYLSEDEREEVANARADIYDLQWKRIEILKDMGNQTLLIEALKDYSTVVGYNQDKAKSMLHSLESE